MALAGVVIGLLDILSDKQIVRRQAPDRVAGKCEREIKPNA
jgi:hypothetical protein